MAAYYNEIDPYAAQWLRNLIAENLIAPGDVDERSIVEVQSDDLREYTQCHFFAGIGGWSLALRYAMWPDDRPVWTGSCPCQPFSSAGRQGGQSDERHLWPSLYRLIRECRPSIIFGEQVKGAIAKGWLDDVFCDLEKEENACASAVLSAYGVKCPQPRDRIFWVAHCDGISERRGFAEKTESARESKKEMGREIGERFRLFSGRNSEIGNMASTECSGSSESWISEVRRTANEDWQANSPFYADQISDVEWIEWPKGKFRPIKRGLRLLVNGLSFQVVRDGTGENIESKTKNHSQMHKCFGNAIVPEEAAQFIKASWECIA